MGHTEDGPFEAENNMYLVEVDIQASYGYESEHFIGNTNLIKMTQPRLQYIRSELPWELGWKSSGVQHQRRVCMEHERLDTKTCDQWHP